MTEPSTEDDQDKELQIPLPPDFVDDDEDENGDDDLAEMTNAWEDEEEEEEYWLQFESWEHLILCRTMCFLFDVLTPSAFRKHEEDIDAVRTAGCEESLDKALEIFGQYPPELRNIIMLQMEADDSDLLEEASEEEGIYLYVKEKICPSVTPEDVTIDEETGAIRLHIH